MNYNRLSSGMIEHNYEFRRRLDQVHVPGRRNSKLNALADEVEIDEGRRIVVSTRAAAPALNAARDLQDYLQMSMNIPVLLVRVKEMKSALNNKTLSIILATANDLPDVGKGLARPRSYRMVCSKNSIIICGFDECGTAQGSYYLEDLMNLREAPFLKTQDIIRAPVFSPRMVHSGWGMDQFPDEHLNAMAHYGFDSILVFARGVDHTTTGYQDFNAIVERAYGALFKACPKAKGIVLVGESVEFPSKDEWTRWPSIMNTSTQRE